MKVALTYKGGKGSGHRGHAGIPGEVGGSKPRSFRTPTGGYDFDAMTTHRATLLANWSNEFDANKPFAYAYYQPDDGFVVTASAYDANLVDALRNIPGSKFKKSGFIATSNGVKGVENAWIVPEKQSNKLVGVLNKHAMRPNTENLKRSQDIQNAKAKVEQERKAAAAAKRDAEYRALADKTPATSNQISYIQSLLTRYINANGTPATIQDFGDISKLRASTIIDMLKTEDLASSFGLFPAGGGGSDVYGGEP